MVPDISATQLRQIFRSAWVKRPCRRRSRQALQVSVRNRILFRPSEIENKSSIRFPSHDDRAKHILQILKLQPGDQVKIGIINGAMGQARVAQISPALILECHHWVAPLPTIQLYLLLAMPRPKVMKRLWSSLACLGVTRVYITGAEKVEKVYFGSHALEPTTFIKELIIGAEQAGDTRLPAVFFSKSLKATLATLGLPGRPNTPTMHKSTSNKVQTLLAEGATELCVSQTNPPASAIISRTDGKAAAVHDSDEAGTQQASLMCCVAPEKSNFQAADGGHDSYARRQVGDAVKLLAHTAGGMSVRQAVHDHFSQCTAMASPSCTSDHMVFQDSGRQVPSSEVCAAAAADVGSDESVKSVPVAILAVGPEGGWIPSEVALLTEELGFQTVTTAGGRTLDTTTAIISLVSLVGEAMMDCSRDT
ncbi:hypothetical protein ABBQ32_002807 [Trebouxia sp. C0010 RCD-2024]